MGVKQCPNYRAPRYYMNPETDEGVEGTAICEVADKPCLVEYGCVCQEYLDWLKECKENGETS